jgi:hypothetical protein
MFGGVWAASERQDSISHSRAQYSADFLAPKQNPLKRRVDLFRPLPFPVTLRDCSRNWFASDMIVRAVVLFISWPTGVLHVWVVTIVGIGRYHHLAAW